jgi:hypothetical protein
MSALRNFRQGFRLGEPCRTASTSLLKLSCRFLRVIQAILHPPGWWYTSAVAKKKPKSANLTAVQTEIIGQFKDLSFENPKMTFEQVARSEFGPNLFPGTPNGRHFEKECRKVFDKEREG